MALKLEVPDGATPIDPDEAAGLIPPGIATRAQLDEYESANIAQALAWASQRRRDVLAGDFLKELHRRMFGAVWRWAGAFRTSERNVGVAPHDIPAAMRNLVEDAKAQVVHPFANGNGRHARLATDLLLEQLGLPHFSWGARDLQHAGEARERYIAALRDADRGDIRALMDFLRHTEENGGP